MPGDPNIWVHEHLSGPNGRVSDEVALGENREMGTFTVTWADLERDDLLVMCPECDNGHVVHADTWYTGSTKEEGSRSTRVCPYCGLESDVLDIREQARKNKARGR